MNVAPAPRAGRNIELKARLTDLASARQIAQQLATVPSGVQHQVDTYFHCPRGRLKLRQIDGLSAVLIAYERDDRSVARSSDYHLVPINNPETLKRALTAALGVRAVVDKRREIFLWHNVRIHLDTVQGLGTFIEFEAVMGPTTTDEQGHQAVAELTARFAIEAVDLVSQSYGNLILAPSRANTA